MTLRMQDRQLQDAIVYCDGKRVDFIRDGDSFAAHIAGEHEVRIDVIDRPEQLRKGYLWQTILFWVAGLAGFFTPRYDKRCLTLCYSLRVGSDANVKLTILRRRDPRAMQRAVYYESDAAVTEEGNPAYAKDPSARRRRRVYLLLSWLARIGIAVAIVFALI